MCLLTVSLTAQGWGGGGGFCCSLGRGSICGACSVLDMAVTMAMLLRGEQGTGGTKILQSPSSIPWF